MTLKVLAGVRDLMIIVVVLLALGFGAYAYGQLAGMAERLSTPAVTYDGACDDSYPDALPC